jgi:hypothetical protein
VGAQAIRNRGPSLTSFSIGSVSVIVRDKTFCPLHQGYRRSAPRHGVAANRRSICCSLTMLPISIMECNQTPAPDATSACGIQQELR